MNIEENLIVIVGPTASGKSNLAVSLACKYNCEIINADAYGVYKQMDIGTAKASLKEREKVKHHLIDIVDYDSDYNVFDFQKDARKIIDDKLKKNEKIIIVGGSTLYVQAILYKYNFKSNDEEFDNIKSSFESYSINELQEIILKSSIKLNNSDFNNHNRLVTICTKIKLGIKIESESLVPFYNNFIVLGIKTNRDLLYQRIDLRVDLMIKNGLIHEVKQFKSTYNSQKAIGYKEVHQYLNNQISEDEMIEKIKKNSRNYAKRQLTWYNNKMKVIWIEKRGEEWIRC